MGSLHLDEGKEVTECVICGSDDLCSEWCWGCEDRYSVEGYPKGLSPQEWESRVLSEV